MEIRNISAQLAKLVVLLLVMFLYFGLFPPRGVEAFPHLNFSILVITLIASFVLLFSQEAIAFPVVPFLLIVFMVLSSIWAQNPTQTIANSFFYLVLFGCAIVLSRYQAEVRAALSCALALSVFLSMSSIFIASPSTWVTIWSRIFAGIYSNNNGFAFVLICALPALLSLVLMKFYLKAIRFTLVSFVVLFIFLSGSETELGALIATLAVWGIINFSKNLNVIAILAVPVISALILIGLLMFPSLLTLIGKDPTIAGRTTLWAIVFTHIQNGSFVGMGWTNSWPDNSKIFLQLQEMGMPLHHAHNEMLNWLLTLGVLGLALVLWIYISMIVGGVKVINSGQKGVGTWVVLTSVAFFVRGLSEISETNALGWFILMVSYSTMMYSLNKQNSKKLSFPFLPRVYQNK